MLVKINASELSLSSVLGDNHIPDVAMNTKLMISRNHFISPWTNWCHAIRIVCRWIKNKVPVHTAYHLRLTTPRLDQTSLEVVEG